MDNPYIEERKEAIKWWRTLDLIKRAKIQTKHYPDFPYYSLTGRQIHNIYISVHGLTE